MARMTFKAGEDYMLRLERTAGRSEEIIKKALAEGAGILTTEIRKNLTENLNDPASASSSGSALLKNFYNEISGSLLESLGFTPALQDRDGVWNVKVGFGDPDYDPKGVANQLKARVMESGSSTIRKRPFVRPAVNAKRKEAESAMDRIIMEEIKNTMEK